MATLFIKASKECSREVCCHFRKEFLTRGKVLRVFVLFSEELGAPL